MSRIRGQRDTPSAIVASAARGSDKKATQATRHAQQWQIDALAYYDQIGAVRYASEFRERAFTKLRWYVGRIDENGEITEEGVDQRAIDAWERVQDDVGGRSVLLGTYAKLRFLNGEKYLLWSKPKRNEPEVWEIVSVLELRKGSERRGRSSWKRMRAPGLTPEELLDAADDDFEPVGKNVVVYRLWRRHPAYSMLADAPMRSVLADLEEIVRATQTINARLISRLAGPGILAIPESWDKRTPAGEGTQPNAAENPNESVFLTELAEAMMTAISNPGSADSVVPIVVRVPDHTTGEAKLYKIYEPTEVIRELELREKALARYATGIDMPKEMVLGLGDSNHWNAWAAMRDGWGHIAPDAQAFADEMGGIYLRPLLRQLGVSEPEQYVIAYDASELLVNPDRFKDAVVMHERMVVDDAFLREAGDATDDNAPTDEELARRIFIETGRSVDVSAGVVEEHESAEPDTGEDTEEGAPEEPEEDEEDAIAAAGGMSTFGWRVVGMAEAEVERMREHVGRKIRASVQGACPDCAADVKDVPAAAIAATLGETRLLQAGVAPADVLVRGTATSLVATLARQGVSEAQAQALAEILELHVASTLFDATPSATLPPGFMGRVKALAA